MFLLTEHASGYALFEHSDMQEAGIELAQVQTAILDVARFQKSVKLVSFVPFQSAAHALENCMDVSEGIMNDHLKAFLQINLTKKAILGVADPSLGGNIKAALAYDCVHNDLVRELVRGIRLHAKVMLKISDDAAQLGLGHAYSRSKVKFNVHRVDNMIIQSIALLDQLDKDVNTFAMRIREWYGWHFPELVRIAPDSAIYAKLAKLIKNKGDLSNEHLPQLEAITNPETAQKILDAARASMGTDISEIDMVNIQSFADRVISLTDYRKSLYSYLCAKMHAVAPSLSALIGEIVGARLIAHAGSLTNLAKYPASTIQILGAEKALFRALKTRGNTPKYGLIYHASFIARAAPKNKGRISRVLANKVSIASRIDCFSDIPTSVFGEILKGQVEERLKFYEDGTTPRKNADVMAEALKAANIHLDIDAIMDGEADEEEEDVVMADSTEDSKKRKSEVQVDSAAPKKSKSKKSKVEQEVAADQPASTKKSKKNNVEVTETPVTPSPAKKSKKNIVEPEIVVEKVESKKKSKKESKIDNVAELTVLVPTSIVEPASQPTSESKPKKSKKDKVEKAAAIPSSDKIPTSDKKKKSKKE